MKNYNVILSLIFKYLLFFPIILLAKNIYLDFSACYKKYSYISYSIPITKFRAVTFTKQKNYIFYDPFTKMYVKCM